MEESPAVSDLLVYHCNLKVDSHRAQCDYGDPELVDLHACGCACLAGAVRDP